MFTFLISDQILKSNKAVWFSPSDDQFLFARFDDSGVGIVSLPEVTTYPQVMRNLQEENDQSEKVIRYSKVRNSKSFDSGLIYFPNKRLIETKVYVPIRTCLL